MQTWNEELSDEMLTELGSLGRDILLVLAGVALAAALVGAFFWLGITQKEGWERGEGPKYGCVPGEEVYVYESCKVVK